MDIPRAPAGVNARGGKLWRSLQADLEFEPAEEHVLAEACRAVSRIDELDKAIREHGVMVAGSQGQLVVNPAVAEQRQQQTLLARLLTNLRIDGVDTGQDAGAMVTAISAQARKAANARWSKSKAARGG